MEVKPLNTLNASRAAHQVLVGSRRLEALLCPEDRGLLTFVPSVRLRSPSQWNPDNANGTWIPTKGLWRSSYRYRHVRVPSGKMQPESP